MLGTLCLYWRPDILQLLPWEHGRPDHPITRVRPRPQGWACNQSRSRNTNQQPLWKKVYKQYSELMYAGEKFRHCMRMFAILLLGNNATTIRPSWITLIEAKQAVQMYIVQYICVRFSVPIFTCWYTKPYMSVTVHLLLVGLLRHDSIDTIVHRYG